MKNNIVKGIKGGLAAAVLSASALLGGCGDTFRYATPGELDSDSFQLPSGSSGTSSLIPLAIGGPIKTFSFTRDGRLIGVKTVDYWWGGKQKFGEVYFQFPSNSTDTGYSRARDGWDREMVALTYKLNETNTHKIQEINQEISTPITCYENWEITRIPYGTRFNSIRVVDNIGRCFNMKHPLAEAFYVKKDGTLEPVNKKR